MKNKVFLVVFILCFLSIFKIFTSHEDFHLESFYGKIMKNESYNYADFDKVTLWKSKIFYTDLSHITFRWASTERVLFEHISFIKSYFDKTKFKQTTFRNCFAANSSFYKTSFNEVIIDGLDASNSNFEQSTFKNMMIQKLCTKYSNFKNSNFEKVIFNNTIDLSGSDFANAHFKDVIFSTSIIVKGANFKNTKGLTNIQKRFLKDSGAINVPIEIEYAIDVQNSEADTEIIDGKTVFQRFGKWCNDRWNGVHYTESMTQTEGKDFKFSRKF